MGQALNRFKKGYLLFILLLGVQLQAEAGVPRVGRGKAIVWAPGMREPRVIPRGAESKEGTERWQAYFDAKRTFRDTSYSIRVSRHQAWVSSIQIHLLDRRLSAEEQVIEAGLLASARSQLERSLLIEMISQYREIAGHISFLVETELGNIGEESYHVVDLSSVEFRPILRNQGIMKRFLKDLIAGLQSFSTSPRSRIELLGVTDSPEEQLFPLRQIGTYIWPLYGFDFDDRDPVSVRSTSFNHQKEGFVQYLRSNYLLPHVGLTDDQGLSQAELDQVVHWLSAVNYPWELSQFQSSHLIGRSIGKEGGKLGKEFLLARDGVAYSGVLYYNQPGSAGMTQFRNYTAH